MAELKSTVIARLYMAIEVNLLLWLAVCGLIWTSACNNKDYVKYAVTGGAIVAAIIQHWAYYNLRRNIKRTGYLK